MREDNYIFKHMVEENPEKNEGLATEHFHTSYELLYFLRGDGDFIIQHNRYRLRPHNLLMIQPGTYHHLLPKPGSTYERIVLRFSDRDIPSALREQLSQAESVYSIRGTRLAEELLRLAAHCAEIPEKLVVPVLKSQLNIIIAYLCCSRELSLRADYQDEDVRRIITYIEENLPHIQNMDQISRSLHMSKSLLQKRFFDHLRTPVMSYVRTQKCMLAQSLLQKGVPATSVYIQCGFADYSSFYRAYTKVFHCSPVRRR